MDNNNFKMIKPDYHGGSIVNLMSSIKRALGGRHPYPPLRDFDASRLKDKNIVLITLDGLGFEFLMRYGKGTYLEKNLDRKLTSVFPSTTATAMTALNVGFPAQQHGLTGWFVYFKEIGMVTIPLPFVTRSGVFSLAEGKIAMSDLSSTDNFLKGISVHYFALKSEKFSKTPYSNSVTIGAERIPYKTLDDAIRLTDGIIRKKNKKRKYVNIYWHKLDTIIHNLGTGHKKSRAHLRTLDKKMRQLVSRLHGTGTVVIVTSDHGLDDTKEVIMADDHKEFYETLALPLTGDSRLVYCYVKPGKTEQFENFVRKKFKNICVMKRSEEIIKENYFGLFKAHPRLQERIGDYVLIVKEGYAIKDKLMAERFGVKKANHGGMADSEMHVPLIVFDC